MVRITIEIEDAPDKPNSKTFTPGWLALQEVVRTAMTGACSEETTDDDDCYTLVRIDRDDHASGYREHGSYTCETRNGCVVRLRVE